MPAVRPTHLPCGLAQQPEAYATERPTTRKASSWLPGRSGTAPQPTQRLAVSSRSLAQWERWFSDGACV